MKFSLINKVFALALFFGLMLGANSVKAQVDTTANKVKWGPRNVVKINPLSEVWGNAGLQYERALSEKMSLNTTISLLGFNNQTQLSQTMGFGVGAGTDLRFYFPIDDYGQAPQGFYFGPTARVYQLYGQTTGLDENNLVLDEEFRAGSYSLGAVLGHQLIILDALAIDAWMGANIITVVDQSGEMPANVEKSLPLSKKGMGLKYGLSIGYSF